MKLRTINEGQNGTWWVLDHIAQWDAPSKWERRRLAAMQAHLEPGMVLYDVGTEFGWLSLVYGAYVGHENMVLCEPGTSFWSGIRQQWVANNLRNPYASVHGYISDRTTGEYRSQVWPNCAELDRPEPEAMAYGMIGRDDGIPEYTVDYLTLILPTPDALTIDVEGAELKVLMGARQTLRTQRPLVFCSVHPDLMERDFDTDVEQLYAFMGAESYHPLELGTDHERHVLWVPL